MSIPPHSPPAPYGSTSNTPLTYNASTPSAGPSRAATAEPYTAQGTPAGEGQDDSILNSADDISDSEMGGDEDEQEQEGEGEESTVDSPAELSELDPINSGAQTPAQQPRPLVQLVSDPLAQQPKKPNKAANFTKSKGKSENVNVKGMIYTVVDDEITLDIDERGEKKIDFDGNLLDGRQFKIATFSSPMRKNPNKKYMLSIDAARAAGYRDSLYFFRKNPLIHKLACSQSEKERLIDLGKLSQNLRSRAITMVSARNVFKIMGAGFVMNGRYIFDDYYEDQSLAAGHKPGEPAHIETYDPAHGGGGLDTSSALYGKPKHAPITALGSGLSSLSHAGKPRPFAPANAAETPGGLGGSFATTFGAAGSAPFSSAWDPVAKKARPAPHLSAENWQHEYAKHIHEVNRELTKVRRLNVGQVEVGYGVVEREEDKWAWEEREVDSDEEEKEADAAALRTTTSSSRASVGPPAPQHFVLEAIAASPAPVVEQREPSAVPYGQPPAKRTKRVRVLNPIRGVYDPETYIPHVAAATQPSTCSIYKVDEVPHLFAEPEADDEDEGDDLLDEGARDQSERERRVKRRWEAAAAKRGIASVTYVVDPGAEHSGEPLVAGMWDFEAGPGAVVIEG